MFQITGRLKRDAHRNPTRNPEWVQYLVSVSLKRSVKQQDGTFKDEWTDYSANVMAKAGKQDEYYSLMLRKGNVVELIAAFLAPKSREHNGQTYLEIRMEDTRLGQVFETVKRDADQQGGQRQSNSGNAGSQQQSQQRQQYSGQQQSHQRAPDNEPPMDFDDDIPF